MQWSFRYLRFRLGQAGLLPTSKLALAAWYLLGLDALLALVQEICSALKLRFGEDLAGWISFLSIVVIVLFSFLAFRWIKAKLLWRLRNRLIVTYVFIGVIPVVLLVALALGSFYLFAGQFATFIVTSELNSGKGMATDSAKGMAAGEVRNAGTAHITKIPAPAQKSPRTSI